MIVDGARRQAELGGDLLGGVPGGGEVGDASFLGAEGFGVTEGPFSGGSGSTEFTPCPVRPRPGAQPIEGLGGELQGSPRLGVATHPAQPHTLCQSDSRVVKGEIADAGMGQRGLVEIAGFGIGRGHGRNCQRQRRHARGNLGQV